MSCDSSFSGARILWVVTRGRHCFSPTPPLTGKQTNAFWKEATLAQKRNLGPVTEDCGPFRLVSLPRFAILLFRSFS